MGSEGRGGGALAADTDHARARTIEGSLYCLCTVAALYTRSRRGVLYTSATSSRLAGGRVQVGRGVGGARGGARRVCARRPRTAPRPPSLLHTLPPPSPPSLTSSRCARRPARAASAAAECRHGAAPPLRAARASPPRWCRPPGNVPIGRRQGRARESPHPAPAGQGPAATAVLPPSGPTTSLDSTWARGGVREGGDGGAGPARLALEVRGPARRWLALWWCPASIAPVPPTNQQGVCQSACAGCSAARRAGARHTITLARDARQPLTLCSRTSPGSRGYLLPCAWGRR